MTKGIWPVWAYAAIFFKESCVQLVEKALCLASLPLPPGPIVPCSCSARSQSLRLLLLQGRAKSPRETEESTREREQLLPLCKIPRSVKILWGVGEAGKAQMHCCQAPQEIRKNTRLSDFNYTSLSGPAPSLPHPSPSSFTREPTNTLFLSSSTTYTGLGICNGSQ